MLYVSYAFLRLRRFWKQSVIVVLIFAALLISLSAAADSLTATRLELTALKKNTPITVTMTSSAGREDGLNITQKQLNDFMAPDGLITPYVQNLRVYTQIGLVGIGVEDSEITEQLRAERPRFYGMNHPLAIPAMRNQSTLTIQYLDGYSAESFAQTKAVCVVGEKMLALLQKNLGDKLTVRLKSARPFAPTLDREEIDYEFTIIGTITNDSSCDIYGSWASAAHVITQSDTREPYAHGLYFEFNEPDALEEFKEAAFQIYLDAATLFDSSSAGNSPRLALRVQDALFLRASTPLEENVQTLSKLIPFLYTLTAIVAVTIGSVLTVRRRHELAILAGLGFGRGAVLLTGVLEYAMLVLLSVIVGGIGYFAFAAAPPNLTATAILAALTLAGTLLAAICLSQVKLIKRIKRKE